jgi:hypothetical protein
MNLVDSAAWLEYLADGPTAPPFFDGIDENPEGLDKDRARPFLQDAPIPTIVSWSKRTGKFQRFDE